MLTRTIRPYLKFVTFGLACLTNCGRFEEDKHYKEDKSFGHHGGAHEEGEESIENPKVTDDGGLGSLEEQANDAEGVSGTGQSPTTPPPAPGGDSTPTEPPPTGSAKADDYVRRMLYSGLPRSNSVLLIDNPKASGITKWLAETSGETDKIKAAIDSLSLTVESAITAGDGRFSEMHQTLRISAIPETLTKRGVNEKLINSKTILQFAESGAGDYTGCPGHFSCLTKIETKNEALPGITFCFVDTENRTFTGIPNSISPGPGIKSVYEGQFQRGRDSFTSIIFEAVRFNQTELDCSQIKGTVNNKRQYRIGDHISISSFQFIAKVNIEKHNLNARFFEITFNYEIVDPSVPVSEREDLFEARTGLQRVSIYRLESRGFYPLYLRKAFSFPIPPPNDDPFKSVKLEVDFRFVKTLELAQD